MTLTTPLNDTALVVVDLQRGTAGNPFFSPFDAVAERARELTSAFSGQEFPVVIATFALSRPGADGQPSREEPDGFREARDLGYEIVIASDAVTDLRAETHENSLQRIFPMLAQVATTAEILAALDRWGSAAAGPAGKFRNDYTQRVLGIRNDLVTPD